MRRNRVEEDLKRFGLRGAITLALAISVSTLDGTSPKFDGFDTSVLELKMAANPTHPNPSPPAGPLVIGPYVARPEGFYLVKEIGPPDASGARNTTEVRLTNFIAVIIEQIIIDDGSGDEKVRRIYVIEAGVHGSSGCRFEISADAFLAMGWVDRYLGSSATLYPGIYNHRDHAAVAIKQCSGFARTRHRRTHLGWIEIGGRSAFLHRGGAIGSMNPGHPQASSRPAPATGRPAPSASDDRGLTPHGSIGPLSPTRHGPITYETQLPRALRHFELPLPLRGLELKQGIEAVFDLVNAASPAVGFALLGACFGPPSGASKTYVNLIGSTDSGKSVYAGLFQSFYGSKFNAKILPAHWGATANYLERLLYHAKDVMVVIDDFLTRGQLSDVQRQQAKADQVLRALFNNAGRGRAQGDGGMLDDMPPRASVVSTAELPFTGLSIKNRGLNLDHRRDDLDWSAITRAQERASQGVFAGVMSAFLAHWADAGRTRALREENAERVARNELPGRGREAGVVASLYKGVREFLSFALASGISFERDLEEIGSEGWNALIEAVKAQRIEDDDPVEFFFSCLQSALISGRAYVCDPDGGVPQDLDEWDTDLEAWGWHRWTSKDQVKTFDEDDGSATTRTVAVTTGWRPKGQKIGWISGTTLYLLPAPSLNAAKTVARGIDATVDFTLWTLGKTLFERGILLKSERKRNRYTARQNLGGGRPNVLIVSSTEVMPLKARYPAYCQYYDCEDHEIPEILESFEGLLA